MRPPGSTPEVVLANVIDKLRLEHDIRSPGRARHWIVQRCHAWDCDGLADHAALLTSELVTNVFLHARTDCLVEAAFEPPTLTVSVTDGDVHDVSPQSPGTGAEAGRGLAIIAALADAWGVEHGEGTKSVWFDLGGQASR